MTRFGVHRLLESVERKAIWLGSLRDFSRSILSILLVLLGAPSTFAVVNGTPAIRNDLETGGLAQSVVAVMGGIPPTLQEPEGSSYLCTGTLIDDRVVLTAAHCLEGLSAENITIGFNVLFTPSDAFPEGDPQGQGAAVSSFLIHPEYSHATGKRFDIALLKLARLAPFKVPRAKLANSPLAPQTMKSFLPIGFGTVNDAYSATSSTNGKGTLNYVKRRASSAKLVAPGTLPKGISENGLLGMISIDATETSACLGDSGGPLFASNDGLFSNIVIGVSASVYPSYLNARGESYFDHRRETTLSDWLQRYPESHTCLGNINIYTNIFENVGWLHNQINQLR